MKLALKILFIIFILWMLLGGYLEYINHSKGPVVMGLGVMYLSFIFMPIFIYWRYKDGKYKKYIINDKTLLGEMKNRRMISMLPKPTFFNPFQLVFLVHL